MISRLTTDLLEVDTNSESVILNEFSSDWVLDSLLRFKFSSMRIIFGIIINLQMHRAHEMTIKFLNALSPGYEAEEEEEA